MRVISFLMNMIILCYRIESNINKRDTSYIISKPAKNKNILSDRDVSQSGLIAHYISRSVYSIMIYSSFEKWIQAQDT